MKDITKQRTVAFLAHGGAGKTSLIEAMLFLAKVNNRLGSVADGTSIMDFEPEEIKRKISLNAAFHSFVWKKNRITVIDTPGGQNFLNETQTVLQGADSAVFLVDAVDMVKVSTERAWDFADELKMPRIILINKIDKERADFYKTLENINQSLESIKSVPIVLPIGSENNFNGIIDLITLKAYSYSENGQPSDIPIPNDMENEVQHWHNILIECIAESNDDLLEKFLEEHDLSENELVNGLKYAVLKGSLAPVVPISALKLIGVSHALNIIADNLPSPLDRDEIIGFDNNGLNTFRRPENEENFSALVIKTLVDPFAGQLSVLRIFSGSLTPDSTFYNSNKSQKERFGQILALEGKNQKPLTEAGPGDIIAVAKLKFTQTGDTLCDENAIIIYQPPPPMGPVVSFAVAAKIKGEEDKVFAALNRMIIEDQSLSLSRNEQTKEIILSGMGQLHIDTTLEKLKRKYNVELVLQAPKVAYKETIKGKSKAQGKYKKQTGGKGQYGDVVLEIEPLEQGKGFAFEDKIVGGVVPKQFIPAVEKGIVEAMEIGIVSGNPVVDCKASLVFGSYHNVDSSEMAFKIAGSMAFKKAFLEANPTILEPIMLITITSPEEFIGDIMGDISSRRGKLLGTEVRGKNQIIKAHVPQAELLSYSSSLTSITSGRGSFLLELAHYDEVPPHIKDKITTNFNITEEND